MLGKKIQQLRKGNGMSQEELASRLTISRQAISKWELGESMPDTENVVQLSKLFGVSTDYLLNDEIEKDSPDNNSCIEDTQEADEELIEHAVENEISENCCIEEIQEAGEESVECTTVNEISDAGQQAFYKKPVFWIAVAAIIVIPLSVLIILNLFSTDVYSTQDSPHDTGASIEDMQDITSAIEILHDHRIVTDVTLRVGDSVRFSLAGILKPTDIIAVIWESSDESVFAVERETGEINVVGNGSATLVATTYDGAVAECIIRVR